LGDLFIHGIGGAKYDELTDEIIRRFYGIEPPAFLTLSATLRLPIPRFTVSPSEPRQSAQLLRDLYWNPQRHMEPQSHDVRHLLMQKAQWIQQPASTPAERRQRFRTLRQLTEALRPHVAGRERDVKQSLKQAIAHSQANALHLRRDYAFCLFPERRLRGFCTSFFKI
jgi:hypothetical protein